jgi:uncharacterized protein (TIGR02246 family)
MFGNILFIQNGTITITRSRAIAIFLGLIISLIIVEKPAQALPQLPLTYANSSDSTLTEAEIHSIVQRARNAWVNGDAEAFASLFTPDGEFLVPGNRWVGHEAIRQVAADFAASVSEVNIEIRRIMIDGNQAAVEWAWEDTNSSGYRNQADDVIIIDFVDGQISRWREYIDTQTPQP